MPLGRPACKCPLLPIALALRLRLNTRRDSGQFFPEASLKQNLLILILLLCLGATLNPANAQKRSPGFEGGMLGPVVDGGFDPVFTPLPGPRPRPGPPRPRPFDPYGCGPRCGSKHCCVALNPNDLDGLREAFRLERLPTGSWERSVWETRKDLQGANFNFVKSFRPPNISEK